MVSSFPYSFAEAELQMKLWIKDQLRQLAGIVGEPPTLSEDFMKEDAMMSVLATTLAEYGILHGFNRLWQNPPVLAQYCASLEKKVCKEWQVNESWIQSTLWRAMGFAKAGEKIR